MKHLKMGFASIIAILAVTLTIAAQAGAFESKKAVALPDCYLLSAPGTTLTYDPNNDCNFPAVTITRQQDCSATAVVDAPDQKIFSGLSSSAKVTPANLDVDCPSGDRVCCVFVEEDLEPCPDPTNQQSIDLDGTGAKKWIIDQVRCRTQTN